MIFDYTPKNSKDVRINHPVGSTTRLRITHGRNTVDDQLFFKLEQTPFFKDMVKNKLIKVVESRPKSANSTSSTSSNKSTSTQPSNQSSQSAQIKTGDK